MRATIHSRFNALAHAGFGYGLVTKDEYSSRDRLLGFLALTRPIFLIMTPLNAASAVVLGLNSFPSLLQSLLGFVTVAFAGGAVNIFNDYVDRERDRYIWQDRPIPGGRVKPKEALITVIFLFVASLAMSWFFFNPITSLILLVAVTLGCLYSLYFRDRVGYLSLPPIVGLIYLGGWAAFSPETLFTSLLPWYLYSLGVVWQAAHIMIYYPLHINNNPNSVSGVKVPPAFFFRPSPKVAVGMGIGFICLTLLLSILLPLLAPLGAVYLVLVLAIGTYALIGGLRLLNEALNRERGLKAFARLSIFRLTISAAILLNVFLAQI